MARRRCRFPPNPKLLAKAAKIEKREHRVSIKIATKIARDHLCENPRYYGRRR